MFALVVHQEGRVSWRKAFALREVNIGAGRDNHLVLDDWKRVSRNHARIVAKDGRYILVDLKSNSGTYVNGRKMTSPLIVKEQDVIVVGPMRIEIVTLDYETLGTERLEPRDDREAELVAAIDAGDDASRLVYADWLEGNGDHALAEVLRVQEQLVDEQDALVLDARTARVRELVSSIDLPWRSRMLRLPIENCPQFAFKCPKQWSELKPMSEGQRHCGACNRTVHYCATIDEARDHAGKGNCVAIDLASPRWTGDLEPPFGELRCDACDLDVGAGLRDCPRCGARVVAEMMVVGEIA